MRRALLLLLLVTFAVPLIADVPLPGGNGLSGTYVSTMLAVSDGDGQLVVWKQDSGLVIHHVDRNGTVTPRGTIAGAYISVESLAATPDGYLMVSSTWDTLRLVSLAPDGTLQSDAQLALPGYSAKLDMAPGSRTALVAGNFGYAVLVDSRGTVLAPAFRFVPAGVDLVYSVAVAASSDGFLIAWTTAIGEVRTRFVSRAGAVGPQIVDSGNGYSPAVASNGTSFLLAWAAEEQLHGRVIGGDGTASGGGRILDPDANYPGPGVGWSGSEYVVLYSGRELRVDAEGVILGRRTLPAGTENVLPTASGAQFWVDRAPCYDGAGKVMMRLHESDAAIPISVGDPEHSSAALAPLGDRFVVAWSEKTDRTRLLVATTDGQSFSASRVLSENGASMPVIVNHLLLWSESDPACERVLKGAILGEDGAVVRRMDITADIASAQPAVAWSGFEYAVVWERRSVSQVVGVRIDADGFVHQERVALSEATQRSSYVNDRRIGLSLAWDGLGYVLVWERYYGTEYPFYPDPPPQIDVRRQFFTTTLSRVNDPAVLEQTGREPALAIGPRLGLTVWRVAEVPYVWLQLFDRNSLVVLAQQALAANGTPLVAAAENHFAVAVGPRVFRVSARGEVTEQPPANGDILALSVRNETAAIVYRKDGRGVLRVWTLEGAGPRRQSVRH
jgi:hypothetical protein